MYPNHTPVHPRSVQMMHYQMLQPGRTWHLRGKTSLELLSECFPWDSNRSHHHHHHQSCQNRRRRLLLVQPTTSSNQKCLIKYFVAPEIRKRAGISSAHSDRDIWSIKYEITNPLTVVSRPSAPWSLTPQVMILLSWVSATVSKIQNLGLVFFQD